MGQITATRNLVATKVVRLAGQSPASWSFAEPFQLCSGVNQRKLQGSASMAFVSGIHRWPVKSPHKGPVTPKMFPFDDVIMQLVSMAKLEIFSITRWLHAMKTISALLTLACERNPSVIGGFPLQKITNFCVFFVVSINNLLTKYNVIALPMIWDAMVLIVCSYPTNKTWNITS